MTYAGSGGGASSGLVGIGASTTNQDQQIADAEARQVIEMQRRMNLIDRAVNINGTQRIDPQLAYQLAQQDANDEELITQALDSMEQTGIREMISMFENMDPDTQAAQYRLLPKETQRALGLAGYNPTTLEKAEPDNFRVFGQGIGIAGRAVGEVWEATEGVRDEVLAPIKAGGEQALHALTVAGDTAAHGFRSLEVDPTSPLTYAGFMVPGALALSSASSQINQSNARTHLLNGQLRSEYEDRIGAEVSDEEWAALSRPYWEQSSDDFMVQTAGSDGNQSMDPDDLAWLMERGNQLAQQPQYGDDFWSRFETTATGSQYVQPVDRLAALNELDGDFGHLELAMRMSSGENPMDILIEQAGGADDPDLYQKLLGLSDITTAPRFQSVVQDLANQRVSIGRTYAQSMGINPTPPGSLGLYNVVSGTMDAATVILLDPTLIAGKLAHTARGARLLGGFMADGFNGLARTRALNLLDEMGGSSANLNEALRAARFRLIDEDLVERAHHGLNSHGPSRLLWADQMRIARGQARTAQHFVDSNRFFDEVRANEDPTNYRSYTQDVIARLPGGRRAQDHLMAVHRHNIEKEGGAGFQSADDILRYFQTENGYGLLLNGSFDRYTRRFPALPTMTDRVADGKGFRRLTRITLDEIDEATRLAGTTPFRRMREAAGDSLRARTFGPSRFAIVPAETPDDVWRAANRIDYDRRITALARGVAQVPGVGVGAKWMTRTANVMSAKVPFLRGVPLAGPDVVDEARSVFQASLLGKNAMLPSEVDAAMARFMAGLEIQDPTLALRDAAARAGFDDAEAVTLARQAADSDVDSTVRALRDLHETGSDEWNRLDVFADRLATTAPVVNVAHRRQVFHDFWYTYFDRAGLLDPANVEGNQLANKVLRQLGGENYSGIGLDTHFMGSNQRQIGIFPVADHSAMVHGVNFKDLMHATAQGDALRKAWSAFNNDWITGFVNNVWKPSMLLRISFIPRAAGEEMMAYLVRDGVAAYFRNQMALAAMRTEDVAPLRAALAVGFMPTHLIRRGLRRTRQLQMLGAGTYPDMQTKIAQSQLLEESTDLAALTTQAARVRNDVWRWWTGIDRPDSWQNRFRQTLDRGGYVSPLRRGGQEIQTAQMRLVAMGPTELAAHYLVGGFSRWARRGLAAKMSHANHVVFGGTARLDDSLLYPAWSVLYGPGRHAGMEAGVIGSGQRRYGIDLKGGTDTQVRMVDPTVDPTVSFPVQLRPSGDHKKLVTDDAGFDNLPPLASHFERLMLDGTVEDWVNMHLGFFSPAEQRALLAVTPEHLRQDLAVDFLESMDDQLLARVNATLAPGSLGGLIDRPVLGSDGKLADWFVDEYDSLLNRATVAASEGADFADDSVATLRALAQRVEFQRTGNLRWFPGEVMDQNAINRVLGEMARRASTWEQRRAINTLQAKFDLVRRPRPGEDLPAWASPEQRDQVMARFEDDMTDWEDEARELADGGVFVRDDRGEIVNRRRMTAEDFTAQFTQDEDGEFLYRVVSEEDWRRIQAQGYVDTDGRHNINDTEEVTLSPTPELGYALNPNGNRVLRIRVDGETEFRPLADVDGAFVDETTQVADQVPIEQVQASEPFVLENPDEWLDPENPPVGAHIRVLDEGDIGPFDEEGMGAAGVVPGFNVVGPDDGTAPLPPESQMPEDALAEPIIPSEEISAAMGVPVAEDDIRAARRVAGFRRGQDQQDDIVTPMQAQTQDQMDALFTQLADELYPGWDNASSNVSQFFRGRSDEIIDPPVISTRTDGPEVAMRLAHRIRDRVQALPEHVQEGIHRLFQGTHNLAPSVTTNDRLAQLRHLIDDSGDRDLKTLYDEAVAADQTGDIEELLDLLNRVEPNTAYLLTHPDLPLWTGTADDLRDRGVRTLAASLVKPEHARFGRDFPWWYETPDGQRVATPLAENQFRYYSPMGDQTIAEALRAHQDDLDGLITQLQRIRQLAPDEREFLGQIVDDLLEPEEIASAVRDNKIYGEGLVPITQAATTDPDLIRRLDDLLDSYFGSQYATQQVDSLPLHGVGQRDFWDVQRSGPPFGLEEADWATLRRREMRREARAKGISREASAFYDDMANQLKAKGRLAVDRQGRPNSGFLGAITDDAEKAKAYNTYRRISEETPSPQIVDETEALGDEGRWFRFDPMLHPPQPIPRSSPTRTFADGSMAVGLNHAEPLRVHADRMAEQLEYLFSTPDGQMLHNVMGTLSDGSFSVDVLRRQGITRLPQRFAAPMYEQVKPNFMLNAIRYGFDAVIEPALDSIIRQPMWLSAYAQAHGEFRNVAQRFYRYAGDETVQSMINDPKVDIESLDEMEMVLADLPREFTDGATLVDLGTWRAMRGRYQDPEALRFYDGFRVAERRIIEDDRELWRIAKGRRKDSGTELVPDLELERDLIQQVMDDDGIVALIDEPILKSNLDQVRTGRGADNQLSQRIDRIAQANNIEPAALIRTLEANGGDSAFTQLLVEWEMATYRWQRLVDPTYGRPTGWKPSAHPIEATAEEIESTLNFLAPYAPHLHRDLDDAREALLDLHARISHGLRRRAGAPSGTTFEDDLDALRAEAAEITADVRRKLLSIQEDGVAHLVLDELGKPFAKLAKSNRPSSLVTGLDPESTGVVALKRRSRQIRRGQGDPAPAIDRLGEVDAVQMATLFKWFENRRLVNQWVERQAGAAATNMVTPYIDDSARRSYFQDYITHLSPFYFAWEQFLRRWGRTFRHTPEGIRKLQLGYQGLEHSGFVETDEFGEDYFVIPVPSALGSLMEHVPVFQHMFGTGAAVPDVLELKGIVRFSMPGIANPTELPGLGPIAGIAMTAAANRWPELQGLEQFLLSERGVDRTLSETLVPTWALQIYHSIALDPDYQNTLAATSIAAIEALEAEGNRLREDAYEARERGEEAEADELEAEAARFSLPDQATAHQRQQWIDEVENYSRRVLLTKGALAFFSPSSPKVTDVDSLRPEFVALLEAGLDHEQATQIFLAAHPEGLPFTISGTDDETLARPQPSQATFDFMQEHGGWMERYPNAAAWFLPQSDDPQPFNRQAWVKMQRMGIRRQLTATEWYDQLAFAEGAMVYFPKKEEMERQLWQLGPDDTEGRRTIEFLWQQEADRIKAQFPVFAEQLENRVGPDRDEIYSQLRMALADPDTPATPQTESMAIMVDSYEAYRTAMDALRGNRTGVASDERDRLRLGFLEWAMSILVDRPELHTLWYSLIQPLAELSSVNMDLDPSTGLPEILSGPESTAEVAEYVGAS